MASKDYYAILGITKTATEADIKQAYRKLSRELHPDKHKGDKEKEAKFKEVNEAYEVLSDAKKRQAYDRFGSADSSGFSGGFQGFGGEGFDPSQFGDLGDMFSSFFGGAAGGGRHREAQTRGRTVETELHISFADAVTGLERQITFETQVTCSDCSGAGAASGSNMKTCGECGGTGAVTRTTRSVFGNISQSVLCGTCRGSGKIPEKPCKKCGGEGRVQEKKTVNVRIPAGIDDGQSLRLTGEGEAGRQGGASGDLVIHIGVRSDPRFQRDGEDIRSTLPLPVIDAVLGTEVSIETVHGVTRVSIPAGTQPGQVLRLKGKGMPVVNTSRHGDHFVTVNVLVPTKLSKEQKKLLEEYKKMR